MSNKTPVPDFLHIAEQLLKGLPQEVADIALAHFNESFTKQGFTDNSFIAWPKRLDASMGHDILNRSGDLLRTLAIRSATMKLVEVAAGDGLPYAAIHNTGGTISVRVTDRFRKFCWYMYKSLGGGPASPDHVQRWKWMALTKKDVMTVHIAKRQYIGESQVLLKNIDRHVINKIITGFKNNKKTV